ncbi:MAG: hypothetical protein CL881_03910 [Dehalococcoidia bacterium]|nr:hypothetical protein [Dehalococcoidia bacterium]
MSTCRVCLEEETDSNKFVYPCQCKGDVGKIHEKCLIKWIETSNRSRCEICSHEYQQKEVLACTPGKYCRGCSNISGSHTKTTLSIFCLSIIVLNCVAHNEIILFVSCTTIAMYVSSAMIACKVDIETAMDSLLLSKIAFTIALTITCLLLIINSETNCDSTCFFNFNTTCHSLCPAFYIVNNAMNTVDTNFFYDMLNLSIIVLLRAIVMFPKYNKKVVFKNMKEQNLLV